jgi:predicted nucleotidyltransferase
MPVPVHPDLELAGRVIRSHLAGHDVRVRLFGSRARGDSRTWSDIDVAVQASPALPAGVLSALRDALEGSSCLLNVDVVDWNDADAALRESIGREGIEWSV